MTLEVRETIRRYRYLGIELPAPPGMTHEQVRDLHSTLYPELISADIEVGEIAGGVQEVTFRRAVGTKGSRLRRLRRAVAQGTYDPQGTVATLASASITEEVMLCSSIWDRCALSAKREGASDTVRGLPEWRFLPPVA